MILICSFTNEAFIFLLPIVGQATITSHVVYHPALKGQKDTILVFAERPTVKVCCISTLAEVSHIVTMREIKGERNESLTLMSV